MSEIVYLSQSLRSLNPKISTLVPLRQISSSFSQKFEFCCFPEKICLVSTRIRAIDALKQDGFLQELDDSPVSVELGSICNESHFDQVMEEAQKLGESVVIVWMAAWCRKCIYLKPKLEKLAAEFYPRLRFYHVDVNSVPYNLVSRAGVTKMPTIQLWRDGQKQGEVIGGHKAHFVVNEVREMIENDSITLIRLQTHPVGATLTVFDDWSERKRIRGPLNAEYVGAELLTTKHGVMMLYCEEINGEEIIWCKSSNGPKVGYAGYIAVSGEYEKPQYLLSDFFSVDMEYKDKDKQIHETEEQRINNENSRVINYPDYSSFRPPRSAEHPPCTEPEQRT